MAGPKVEFTQRQIEYLEQQFPEIIGSANTPTDELRWRSAQRSVIAAIRSRVTQSKVGD